MIAPPLRQRVGRKLRLMANSVLLASSPQVTCNLCGWQGRRFVDDEWHPRATCPRCGSQVRHRLLAAALTEHPGLRAETMFGQRAALHVAPEKMVGSLVQKYTQSYQTADFNRANVDLRLDITQMSAIADGSYGVFIACDVLEHVSDDRQALREIYRVLAPGGWGIFTVPQEDHRQETLEDPNIQTPADREKHYGQWDHVRLYGADFSGRLEEAGFTVTVVDEQSFPPETVARYVLFPPALSPHPLATNYRKVFFAQKP
ncbi:MAG: methyltransferase domain-containing protein [Cyanobacteria bacterium RI_101]|nr:methyltransferase domain-containing protein [Cyanobacteria bacterium RI_101]